MGTRSYSELSLAFGGGAARGRGFGAGYVSQTPVRRTADGGSGDGLSGAAGDGTPTPGTCPKTGMQEVLLLISLSKSGE